MLNSCHQTLFPNIFRNCLHIPHSLYEPVQPSCGNLAEHIKFPHLTPFLSRIPPPNKKPPDGIPLHPSNQPRPGRSFAPMHLTLLLSFLTLIMQEVFKVTKKRRANNCEQDAYFLCKWGLGGRVFSRMGFLSWNNGFAGFGCNRHAVKFAFEFGFAGTVGRGR